MHVLGVPPAFVLSQDQTLKLKATEAAILDVRTSAHRTDRLGRYSLCLLCFRFHQKPKTPNSEADTGSSDLSPTGAIHRRLIHRTGPNRPHISSDTKLSKSTETKSTESARFYLAQPDQAASNLSLRPFEASSPVVPSPAASPPKHPPRRSRRPAVRLSAAGEGLSTGHPADPQPLSHTQTQLF